MKKINILRVPMLFVTVFFYLTGCTSPVNLASMTSYSTEGTGAVNVIEWDGVQYYYFGVGGDQFMGEQIGIVNGDNDDRVYAVKGYDTGAWIIEKYYSGEMDNATLYKEKSVTDIPAELEKFQSNPNTTTDTTKRIIENDGRDIVVNSGAGWNFTLTEEKLVRITNKATEYTGTAIDNDFGKYYGHGIDVMTYDTTPYKSTERYVVETYLFVFSGEELIYNTKFITEEHFEFVKNLCNEIAEESDEYIN